MSVVKELEDIIAFAIEREQESVDFYADLLTRVNSHAVAAEISKMINMEAGHRDMLKKIDIDNFAKRLNNKCINLHMAEFTIEKKPTPNMPIKDLFNLAMHRELKSYELYTDLAQLFSGDEKRLFENLAAEECHHKHFFEEKWYKENLK